MFQDIKVLDVFLGDLLLFLVIGVMFLIVQCYSVGVSAGFLCCYVSRNRLSMPLGFWS